MKRRRFDYCEKCRCTETRACRDPITGTGCSWTRKPSRSRPGLCSVCAPGVQTLDALAYDLFGRDDVQLVIESGVECPKCGACPGEECRNKHQAPMFGFVHESRKRAAFGDSRRG